MHFITRKQLSRRTFLRGMGASVGLPFLDAMTPAGRAWGKNSRTSAVAEEPTRLVCIEEVHGLAGCNEWGATQNLFAPSTTGRDVSRHRTGGNRPGRSSFSGRLQSADTRRRRDLRHDHGSRLRPVLAQPTAWRERRCVGDDSIATDLISGISVPC